MQPKTKLPTCDKDADLIRATVRATTKINSPTGFLYVVKDGDVDDIVKLLQDERTSGDVYTLPRPFTRENVLNWVCDHREQRAKGEGLLMCSRDQDGNIISIIDFQFWPQWSACEFGGVIAHAYQSQAVGTKGIAFLCTWVFEHVGVRLIAMTASPDNIRSHKLLDHLGFERLGEMNSHRPDGSIRHSLYWELQK
jgi:RimJ/RimL family protein N-acetyltransferase